MVDEKTEVYDDMNMIGFVLDSTIKFEIALLLGIVMATMVI